MSLAGIPIGLAVGYGISKVLFPAVMGMLDLNDMKISLHFHPVIVIFAAGFGLLTVAVSCYKPGNQENRKRRKNTCHGFI